MSSGRETSQYYSLGRLGTHRERSPQRDLNFSKLLIAEFIFLVKTWLRPRFTGFIGRITEAVFTVGVYTWLIGQWKQREAPVGNIALNGHGNDHCRLSYGLSLEKRDVYPSH